MKMSEAVDFWLKNKKAEGLEANTMKMYEWAIKRFSDSFIFWYSDKDLKLTDAEEILYLLQKLESSSSRHTYRYIRSRVKLFLNDVGMDKIAKQIRIKRLKISSMGMTPIKEEELQLLLMELDRTENKMLVKNKKALKAMITLLYSSGLRNFEMRSLLIRDMDFDNLRGKTISKWVDKKIKLDFVFSQQAAEYMMEYLGDRIDNKNDHVFVDEDGKPYEYHRTWEIFDRLRNVTGVNIWQHRFRHAFSSDLLKKHKMRPKQAMILTRHKHLSSFERYLDEDKEEAVGLYHKQGGLEIHEVDKEQNKPDEQAKRKEP